MSNTVHIRDPAEWRTWAQPVQTYAIQHGCVVYAIESYVSNRPRTAPYPSPERRVVS